MSLQVPSRWAWVLATFKLSCLVAFCATKPAVFTEKQTNHWAYKPITSPALPEVKATNWVATPIDRFILHELEAKNLKPNPRTEKYLLLRRVHLTLIGLPPTPAELQEFLKDPSPSALEKVVDRLLDSQHYGEKWGRHWLDLARFAETEGFKDDGFRPNAWRYRDYVIKSFNEDKPYDRFIHEQIAGDELWPDDFDAKIATAFNRHYPDEYNARNLRQRRQEILNDITDATGAVFTGLTFACARCHHHKIDAISQHDYYRFQSFFANVRANDHLVLMRPEEEKIYNARLAEWEEKTAAIRQRMAELEAPKRKEILKDITDKYPKEVQLALEKKSEDRTPFEALMAAKASQYLDPDSYQYQAPEAAVIAKLKGEPRKEWDALKAELEKFAPLHPGPLPIATAAMDLSSTPPSTHLLKKGVYDAYAEEVEPGLPDVFGVQVPEIIPTAHGAGRRTALAKMLTDPKNPLTARVIVNRIWHYHFGKGIVGSGSDFGLAGDRPTHPELLDWLATDFVKNGWRIKRLHRMIVLSSTFQQSTLHRAEAAQVDPENKLYWKSDRRRLDGELIRDSALQVAGILNPKMGGPSIHPELPPGMPKSGWKFTPEEEERNRRSVYVFVKRNARYPLFDSFDFPDTHESCSRRNVTTTPLQALNLLNSEVTLKWANRFAGNLLKETTELSQLITTAYVRAYARPPEQTEIAIVKKFIDEQERVIAQRIKNGQPAMHPDELPESVSPAKAAAIVDFCHALINSNEFVYRN